MSLTRPRPPAARADLSPSQALRQHWARLQARERRLIALALTVLGLALLWALALAPALRTLRQAPAQLAQLQAQAQHMQAMQREAHTLASQSAPSRDQALQALRQASEQRLGRHARLNVSGNQVQVELDQAPAAELAAWLADARVNARSRPSQAQLRQAAPAADAEPNTPRWSGTLVLQLP